MTDNRISNHLQQDIIKIAGKTINKVHIEGPLGVRGRKSDNRLIKAELNWEPKFDLDIGLDLTTKHFKSLIKNEKEN